MFKSIIYEKNILLLFLVSGHLDTNNTCLSSSPKKFKYRVDYSVPEAPFKRNTDGMEAIFKIVSRGGEAWFLRITPTLNWPCVMFRPGGELD